MFNTKKIMTLALTSVMMVSAVPMVTMAYSSKSGWVEKDGKWYYYEDGRKIKSDIRYDSDKDGYCLLNSSGVRVNKKGWATTKTQYTYYGDKYKETRKYYVKSNGTVYVSKWKKIGGKYYYFDYNGKMVKGTSGSEYNSKTKVTKYYLAGSNGVRITKKGWHKVKSTYYDTYNGKKVSYTNWYYVKKNGEVARGVYKVGGKKYVFGDSGALSYNTFVTIYDSKTGKSTSYAADKKGILITKKGWLKFGTYSYSYTSEGMTRKYTSKTYVYINKGGKLATGLKKISGKYYYFGPVMYTNDSYYDEATDTKHFFGKSGARKLVVKNYSKTSTVE